jgi:hypothetical protein
MRPVYVDDTQLHMLAYSAHDDRIDSVRLTAITHREPPPDVTAWTLKQGILKAVKPLRTPANDEIGMQARVCVPIRSGPTLHGFIWLIDEPPLGHGEIAAAADAAAAAAVAIQYASLRRELDQAREGALFRDLVSDSVEIRRHASHELLETGTLVSTVPVAVLCVKPVRVGNGLPDESGRQALQYGLERLWKFASPRHSLRLLRPDHAAVLVVCKDPMLRSSGVEGLAEGLASSVAAALPESEGWRVLVGIGDAADERSDAFFSYAQARAAARLAQVVPTYGPVVSWSRIGVYRTLMTLTAGEVMRDGLHPGLVRLFEHPDSRSLVQTLELFFDLAADAPAAAEKLCIHRATFYYRLHRIERISGLSLASGDDRLALHLGLKLARLAGVHPLFTTSDAARSAAIPVG